MTSRSLTILFFLCGCTDVVTDQCLRVELAFDCLRALPAGPETTTFNDWAEVVALCDYNAVYQAKRLRQYVKPECTVQ